MALTSLEAETTDSAHGLGMLALAGLATDEQMAQLTDDVGTPYADALETYKRDEAAEITARAAASAGWATTVREHTNRPHVLDVSTPEIEAEIARLTASPTSGQPSSSGAESRADHANAVQLSVTKNKQQAKLYAEHDCAAEDCDEVECPDHEHQISRGVRMAAAAGYINDPKPHSANVPGHLSPGPSSRLGHSNL